VRSVTKPLRKHHRATVHLEWYWMLAILAATIVAYTPSLGGGFLWDDPQYIRDNPLLRDFAGLVKIWISPTASPQWYPVTFTSFWIEYQLWATTTGGYHFTNLLLHCASVVLLWRILKRLDFEPALLAAGIFALHPLMTESVAWMTERKNTLSLFLGLVSLWFWLKTRERFEVRSYILCVVCFILSLLSKSVVATLPAVFLVIVWWRHGRIAKADWMHACPLFLGGIAMACVTAYLESKHVGASAALTPELNLTMLQRIVIAGRVIWFYAVKLIWPVNQSFIYPRWEIPTTPSLQLIAPIAVAVILAALLVLQKKIGRGPFAAVAIFCGVLLPVLGFFNVYPMRFSFVADHFAYHASIALIVIVATGLTRLHRNAPFIVLVPLAVMTFLRTTVYTDARTLWEDTHARNPSWMVKMNLGNALRFGERSNSADLVRAEQLYREARDLKPDNAETQLLVGIVAGARGNLTEAESCFREAVRINPNHAEAWYYLGESLRFQKRNDEAMGAYDRAIEIDPNFAKAKDAKAKVE
jgi:hypothetical protein